MSYQELCRYDKLKKQKTGGRQKGTPNKATAKVKYMMETFLSDNQDEFISAWSDLNDKEKVQTYLKAAEFILPKPKPEPPTDDSGAGFTVVLQ